MGSSSRKWCSEAKQQPGQQLDARVGQARQEQHGCVPWQLIGQRRHAEQQRSRPVERE
jgi:hypothetical protein